MNALSTDCIYAALLNKQKSKFEVDPLRILPHTWTTYHFSRQTADNSTINKRLESKPIELLLILTLVYVLQDYARLCAATPIAFDKYPIPLFCKDYIPGYDPPLLYCGWLLEDEALFNIVQNHFKNDVYYYKDGRPRKRTSMVNLPYLLHERYKIPKDLQERCELVELGDSNGNLSYGVVLGSNYKGILPKEQMIDSIRDDLFGGQDPRWYLSPKRFKWKPRGVICMFFFLKAIAYSRCAIVTQGILDDVEKRLREESEEMSLNTLTSQPPYLHTNLPCA